MLDLKRHLFKGFEIKIAKIFSFLPFSPNHYTLISIFFAIISSYFIIRQKLILAILFFLIAGFLDFIDGAVARSKNISTKTGAYLDTIADRWVEGILLFGLLFLPLPKILLPGSVWIFLILFGSFLTTYAKAAAKEKGLVEKELKGGFLSRGERIILLLLSLISGTIDPSFILMTYFFILIAFLANFTALERICSALKTGT
jgi:phosphatidylglycerophosphate synthase